MSGQVEVPRERVFIGLGGNVGNPARAIAAALAALARHPQIRVVAISSLYRTPPWGKLDQPSFLNAAAELSTSLEPRKLLAACLEVERSLKRERGERWGPRTIDIDIIAYGDRVIREDGLEIPHARFASRAFVLIPLAEIAGQMSIGGESVTDLAQKTDASGVEKVAERGSWSGLPQL